MKEIVERILVLNKDLTKEDGAKLINDSINNGMMYLSLYAICNYFFYNCKEDNCSELFNECLNIINGTINYHGKGNTYFEEELFKDLLTSYLEHKDTLNDVFNNYNITLITE